MMRETARSVALQALLQMTENEGYSNIIIDKALRSASLSSQAVSYTHLDVYKRQSCTGRKAFAGNSSRISGEIADQIKRNARKQ